MQVLMDTEDPDALILILKQNKYLLEAFRYCDFKFICNTYFSRLFY
jgi:hypothetical protein